MISFVLETLLKPTATTALAWSSALHAGLIVISVAWMPAPADRATFGGQSNTIYVQFLTESQREPTGAVVSPNPPIVVAMKRHDESVNGLKDLGPIVTTTETAVPRRLPQRIESSNDRADSEDVESPRVRRQKLETKPPATVVTVSQILGTDKKTPPTFSNQRSLQYPPEAIRLGLEGDMKLRLFISEAGRVEHVEIIESTGHEILDQAAIMSVKNWRGTPAHINGTAVETVEVLPVKFRLKRGR